MRMSVVLPLVVLSVLSPGRSEAQEKSERSSLADAVHWCTFNQPCNYTAHAALATGIVVTLHRLDVPAEYAFAASSAVFVAKELRDHAKWGVLGSADSTLDLLSGVLGAYMGYRVVKRIDRSRLRVQMARQDGGTAIRVVIPTAR